MKDIINLENLLIKKGRIIKHSNLKEYYKNHQNINNKISLLVKKGWLVNLRRGLYYITKLGSLGHTSISNYIIANSIGEKSFVSFEAALKHHGMFNQDLKKIKSISQKQYLNKQLENIDYQYVKVLNENYFGFSLEKVDGGNALIANSERAILDLIEYQRTSYSVSLVLEKLKDYYKNLNILLLQEYLDKYSLITKKTIGLFFDFLKIKSMKVQELITRADSTSRLLTSSDKFSTKWRIYYDSIFEEQVI